MKFRIKVAASALSWKVSVKSVAYLMLHCHLAFVHELTRFKKMFSFNTDAVKDALSTIKHSESVDKEIDPGWGRTVKLMQCHSPCLCCEL